MVIGYSYYNAIWLSVEDCQEIALSIFEEQIYLCAMRRLAEDRKDWMKETEKYRNRLLHTQFIKRWEPITVFE